MSTLTTDVVSEQAETISLTRYSRPILLLPRNGSTSRSADRYTPRGLAHRPERARPIGVGLSRSPTRSATHPDQPVAAPLRFGILTRPTQTAVRLDLRRRPPHAHPRRPARPQPPDRARVAPGTTRLDRLPPRPLRRLQRRRRWRQRRWRHAHTGPSRLRPGPSRAASLTCRSTGVGCSTVRCPCGTGPERSS